jgi:glyoxylase I family protein
MTNAAPALWSNACLTTGATRLSSEPVTPAAGTCPIGFTPARHLCLNPLPTGITRLQRRTAHPHAMLRPRHIDHVVIISSPGLRSEAFSVNLSGLRMLANDLRAQRQSCRLDLTLPDGVRVAQFSCLSSPPSPSRPEAQGLRHMAFAVDDVERAKARLESQGVTAEPTRVVEYSGRRFTLIGDPDGLSFGRCETNPSTP